MTKEGLQKTIRETKENLYDISREIRQIDDAMENLGIRRAILQEAYDKLFKLIEVMEKDVQDIIEQFIIGNTQPRGLSPLGIVCLIFVFTSDLQKKLIDSSYSQLEAPYESHHGSYQLL